MRRGNKCEIVMYEKIFVGFSLGADFCAEHEWGIDRIMQDYGINTKKNGLMGRKITKLPEYFKYNEKENLISSTRYNSLGELYTAKQLKAYKVLISGAWDVGTFAIRITDEYKTHLKELVEAFKKSDVLIAIGSREGFANGGLNLLIYSRMPNKVKKDAVSTSKKHNELLKTVKKTGIEEILKKAKKRYFALSPRWEDYKKKEIKYWLNPMEQNIHEHGWYTLDDLKLWAKNKGPILNKSK